MKWLALPGDGFGLYSHTDLKGKTRLAGPITLLQITDTHLYADPGGRLLDVETDASLRAVLAHVARMPQRFERVLMTGDLVHDESLAGYRRLRDHLRALQVPVHCTPGNHDNPGAMHAALVDGLVDMPRQILTGDWQILLLDTTVTGSNAGHLADSELTELDAALAAAPARPALICLHHNPIPVGSTWLDSMAIDNGAALLAIIDRHPQVRGVLWGHVHQQFDADRNGVRLLASPSTCVQFLPGSHDFALDDAAPGYRVLTLHPDGRIDSHVERLADYTVRIDRQAGGY